MARLLKDWIQTYLQYSSGQESPEIFHSWAAISTIAQTLRRHVWLDWGYFKVYCNFYIVLVSPTGIGEKSSCISVALPIIEKIPCLCKVEGSMTRAYIAEWLIYATRKNPDKSSSISIISSEFKEFTEGMGKEHPLVTTLTDLYDCKPWSYLTKHEGQYHVPAPCLNLLAGSTPEWLTVGGGFDSRLTVVAITEDERSIPCPKMTVQQQEMQALLGEDLKEIDKLRGAYILSTKAQALYERWYAVRQTDKVSEDIRLAGYYSKKRTQILKLAMILAASESDELVVEECHIATALRSMKALEANLPFAFAGVAIGTGPRKYADHVRQKVKDAKEKYTIYDNKGKPVREVVGIDQSKLVRCFQGLGSDLKIILTDLQHAEEIKPEISHTATKSRVIWCWVEDRQ